MIKVTLYECPSVTVENEKDMEKALEDVKQSRSVMHWLCISLETSDLKLPETLIAESISTDRCMYCSSSRRCTG